MDNQHQKITGYRELSQGGIVERVFTVVERIRTKVSQSKYEPHQGKKEMARRRK